MDKYFEFTEEAQSVRDRQPTTPSLGIIRCMVGCFCFTPRVDCSLIGAQRSRLYYTRRLVAIGQQVERSH
jgi:hypothetical protein